jgi:hypothetical protein
MEMLPKLRLVTFGARHARQLEKAVTLPERCGQVQTPVVREIDSATQPVLVNHRRVARVCPE